MFSFSDEKWLCRADFEVYVQKKQAYQIPS